MNEDDVKERIANIKYIIEELEHNEAFRKVVEDKRKTVELCDKNWHLINLDNKDKLLELKYAKLSAEAIVNTIDIYKQELESLKASAEEQGYYEE